MDGLRKVPDNVPNKEMLAEHLHKPLTEVPDPFGTHESFGHHNNARLRAFLDSFGFDYDFKSSTEMYTSGVFDKALLNVLNNYDKVMDIMLPSLGEERRQTYSPFLPICPDTRHVLQVPILEIKADAGTIVYENAAGAKIEVPVTGGQCKLQWKPDWAMRWHALDVDYEMSGKDLIDSVKLSGRICKVLGTPDRVGFSYELFLDENGEKISKSRGNGLAVEEWLRYAPPESLSQFMFGKPKTAKRLYFDVIPKNVDEYLTHVEKYPGLAPEKQIENPAWHIHGGNPPHESAHMSYNILLNLASVCHTEDKAVLWHFITRYRPDATPENAPILDRLVEYAINYYRDFIRPNKKFRAPSDVERAAMLDLVSKLKALPAGVEASEIQSAVYDAGKAAEFENLRDWFKALYEILLGQSEGPRMGSFIALYGIDESIALMERALNGEDLSA
jgi:lysyl-tRNA synthetase class 1